VEKDDCRIPHTLLVKYGVFSEINASQHVKNQLDKYEFVIDEDFKLTEVRELGDNGKHYN
jgi:hypothetical protein